MKIELHCASANDDHEQQLLLPFNSQAADTHYHCAACKYEGPPKIYLDEVIFPASCMTLMIVLQLPLANYHGKQVPLFVFAGLPPAFRAFLTCLMGACFSSLCSIHIRKTKLKIAWVCYAFAVLFMVATFAIALSATVWEMYKAFPPRFT